jgi:hypothetical protein
MGPVFRSHLARCDGLDERPAVRTLARGTIASPLLRAAAAGALVCATGFVLVGTYYFTRYYWGPAIVGAVAG